MRIAVRHSLLAIAVLGAVTCALSVFALWRLVSSSSAQRLERSRELVAQQLELQRSALTGEPVRATRSPPHRLGMRAGYLPRGAELESIEPALEPVALRALREAARGARSGGDDKPVTTRESDGDTTVVAGAATTSSGVLAWSLLVMQPPSWVRAWRLLAAGLGLAGLLLVAASAHMAFSIQRGASTLRRALRDLGQDLGAPVPRPALRELREVADGVSALAQELRAAQAEQARLSRRLADRERLASLGRVAAGLAHEVRNPLTVIKLRVDLIRMDPALPAEMARELGEVADEIARVDRLVTDLSVIAGRRVGQRADSDLRRLAEQRVAAIEPWAAERGVTLAIRGEARARADTDAVGRVLDNLLRNAVEASAREQRVQVVLEADERAASVSVSDHGPGVDERRAAELFEPFFTTKSEGMGLGLALSRAIAVAHGGELSYRRNEGVTSFELVLPRGGKEPQAQPP
jgi:signal transduction histidine kinase